MAYTRHPQNHGPLAGHIRLQDFALASLGSRHLLRSSFAGGPIGAVKLDWRAPQIGEAQRRHMHELSEEAWKRAEPGDFDGRLVGVFDMQEDTGSLRLSCCEMPYRSFLASASVLRALPQVRVPLALGIHALVFADDLVLTLVTTDGRWSIPGGAVDYADHRPEYEHKGNGTLATAILREIQEESGLDPGSPEILATGVYVGARPPHVAVMATMSLTSATRATLPCDPCWRPDARDRIRSVRWVPLTRLRAARQRLSLSARTALQSLDHCTGTTARNALWWP